MFLTWLLESPSECEIAHMVPRARTLVPISRKCEQAHIPSSGIFATPALRNCSGPSPGPLRTPPAFGGTPSELADAPQSASGAPPVGWPRRGRLRRSEGPSRASGGVCGQGRAPAGAGAFGSAFEVRQDVRQVCGVVAAELFEEVDFDVHWGFLSLFPLCCTSILSTATPRVKPQRCVLRHISGHYKLPNGKTKGSPFQLRTRNLTERNLHLSKLPRGNLLPSNTPPT